jgi:hypothetical protein
LKIETERNKFLVNELSPREKQMYEAFSAQVPILLQIMEEHEKYRFRTNLVLKDKIHT